MSPILAVMLIVARETSFPLDIKPGKSNSSAKRRDGHKRMTRVKRR